MEMLVSYHQENMRGAIRFIGVSDPMEIKKIIEENLIKNKKNP